MKRRKENKGKKLLGWLYLVLFALVVIWFVVSIVKKKNPLDVLQGGFSQLSHNSTTALQREILQKDSIIEELRNRLAAYEGKQIDPRRALVIISTDALNMRSGPSLNTNILAKIPANSEILLLYYDSNTFYIDNQSGKWAYIRYGDTEGWVWGNYIREI